MNDFKEIKSDFEMVGSFSQDDSDSLQRTEEWLEKRKGRFTGSKIKDLMSSGRSSSKMQWGRIEKTVDFGAKAERYIYQVGKERLTGLRGMNISSKQMQHGTDSEPLLIEQLINHLRSPRFHHFINQYSTLADRDLFESEFVRAVWDKPDLTNDELNSYVTLCTNYVRQKHIQQRIDRLNALLNDADSERDVTMRLTELIKATSDELNQCEKRIESLTKDLNGSRQQRLKAKGEENGSIFALVEAFTDKEERDRMIMMAELQNKLIEEEVNKLESMDEYKARILGISKRELL